MLILKKLLPFLAAKNIFKHTVVSFVNIFMAAVETEIINRSHLKPLTWKRYIDDVFSLWNGNQRPQKKL